MINKDSLEFYYQILSSGYVGDDIVQELHDYLLTVKFGDDISHGMVQELWEIYTRLSDRKGDRTIESFVRSLDLAKIEEKLEYRGFIRENNTSDEEYNDLHLQGEFEKVMYRDKMYRDNEWNRFKEFYNLYKAITSRKFYVLINDEPKPFDLERHTITYLNSDEEYYLLDDLLEEIEIKCDKTEYGYGDLAILLWVEEGMMDYGDRLDEERGKSTE